MRWAGALLALTMALFAVPAYAAPPEVIFEAPRVHGWWIGDVLMARAKITVDDGFVPDAASLPRPRAVDYWLDLRAVHIADEGASAGRRVYTVSFDYQTFYAPLEPKRMTVPAVPLVFARGTERQDGTVPAWSFVTAPLREILAPSSEEAMEPDDPIAVVDTLPLQAMAAVSALCGGLALLALAWHRALWPFGRRPRPFSKAAASVAGLLARGRTDDDRIKQACICLHRAFDEALGRRMLASDIDAFLAAQPNFATDGAAIKRFYAASRAMIFGGGAPPEAVSGPALLHLARGLAATERRRP